MPPGVPCVPSRYPYSLQLPDAEVGSEMLRDMPELTEQVGGGAGTRAPGHLQSSRRGTAAGLLSRRC